MIMSPLFGSDNVVVYRPERATALSRLLNDFPHLVFEAHSTDYQPESALAALVRDGFPILKVGPGLTFAYREALYALDLIASELIDGYGNRPLSTRMEEIMRAAPGEWQGHYHGDERALYVQRHYSYSDRIRYYWSRPEAEAVVRALDAALAGKTIPQTLLDQYLPQLAGEIGPETPSRDILIAAVDRVLGVYGRAAG